jgi:hypothetical protein
LATKNELKGAKHKENSTASPISDASSTSSHLDDYRKRGFQVWLVQPARTSREVGALHLFLTPQPSRMLLNLQAPAADVAATGFHKGGKHQKSKSM